MKTHEVLVDFVARLMTRPRKQVALISFVMVLLIGFVDYLTGVMVSLSVVYIFPIGWSAWRADRRYAYFLAFLSIVAWVAGDFLKGLAVLSTLTPVWNAFIRLLFYAAFIEVLCRLRDLQLDLGRHVEERTAALRSEVAERQKLERELMEIGERERHRIGQDLHDSLCQHLTGTALVGQALAERLSSRGLGEAKEAHKVVGLIEEGTAMARSLAKGLHPVAEGADGLMRALEEFAATTSRVFRVNCAFECESPVLVRSPFVATHLFRIAQEAVSNAIKHGPATEITVMLDVSDRDLRLSVGDDGAGIADGGASRGLGLKIMADRARLIGGMLTVMRATGGGTQVLCTVPQSATELEND
jgi:signal transduction histidine kinase